jgi:hypothetical protein
VLVACSLTCALDCASLPALALATTPTVTAVSPDHGPAAGGTRVTVQGSGFAPGASVSLGGLAASEVQVSSPTALTAVSPAGTGTIDVTVSGASGTSPPVGEDWFAYEPAPGGLWLGLNGDSSSNVYNHEWLGSADEFSRSGIVYDRSFDELTAGQLPSETNSDGHGGAEFEDRLSVDHQYGMIPVGAIEYSGYTGNLSPDSAFPAETRTPAEEGEGKTTIAQYVQGFVRSASAILAIASRRYPGMPVLLEPMNEPWAYTTPQDNGAQYAKVIAALLPAARAAGIPLTDIYVSAFGADQHLNQHGEVELFAPGWVTAMYEAEPSLRTEIAGWYFHPYGFPSGTEFNNSWGIQSVPEVRLQMSSGENNIIVSEIGYCAKSEGGDCHDSRGAVVATRAEAATSMTAMLENALPYYEAGWLKALIVYGRGDGGWSMVDYPSLTVSKQGEALMAFAKLHARAEPPGEKCPLAGTQGLRVPLAPASPLACGGSGGEEPGGPPGNKETTGGGHTPALPGPEAASGVLQSRIAVSPPRDSARLALHGSAVRIRGGVARVRLECPGVAGCAGRLTLLLRLAAGHGRTRRLRNVVIGLAALVLRPGESTVTVRLSASGRTLLREQWVRRASLAGVAAIRQTSPAVAAETGPVRYTR